jgi:hypothetical protein
MPSSARPAASLVALATALLVLMVPAAGQPSDAPPSTGERRPVSVQIRWGGGTPRAWTGRIAVVAADQEGSRPLPFTWRTLCTEPDAAAIAQDHDGGIAVHQPRPIGTDGVELTVDDWHRARLVVGLVPALMGGPVPAGESAVALDAPLADVLAAPLQRPLDGDGNRLSVEIAPGDALRVILDPAKTQGPTPADTAVRRPGDVLHFHVAPLLAIKPGQGQFELRLRLARPGDDKPIDSQTAQLVPREPAPSAAAASSGRVPTSFDSVAFELSLPAAEGVYEVVLEAVERGGLRWTRPLAARTLQVVALADTPAERPAATAWGVLYELDPGSPKLHERLRRMPARGLSAVPVPNLALPAMPLPSLSRPRVPLPRLPEVPRLPDMPGLPEVPLPNVAAMVPRLSGLLTTGHSVVVPNSLGPMLRLPPAFRPAEPSWEGIVVAGAQPGMPHVVEIEHPRQQRATVAACVLEPDATAATVEVRHAGGFEVRPSADQAADRIDTHRFVFWPTTRNPVIVIANPSTKGPALVGRVRILAGPGRLPEPRRPATPPGSVSARGRMTLAVFDAPDLHRLHGGPARVAATGGRPVADWTTHLAGIRHSADTLVASDLAGGVVTVYADGAAAWPSRCTRQAARWDPAANGDAGLDPFPKDLLGATATVYGREGLALVPAFRFNAAIPVLEEALAGDAAPGIACVGPDGRPRRLPGGIHYNILDPRVQEAVDRIVIEAAERLAGHRTVAGVALLLPDDGWLHLPGVAWGLDDATFARFLATIGGSEEAADPERFAERARLVTGPLREEWLAWRTGAVVDFYRRLSSRLAAIDARWPLYVVPTTLLAGDLAQRFRPGLEEPGPTPDLFREHGLVAGWPQGHDAGPQAGQLVFMTPHLQTTGASLRERATLIEANRALARVSAAGRRGVVLVTRPLPVDLSGITAHGPFGTATPPGPAGLTIVPTAAEGDAALAEALAATDAEVVFDMRAAVTLPDEVPAVRRAYEALPAGGMRPVAAVPAPLMVRTSASGGVTRVAVVNAGPAATKAVLGLSGPVSAAIDALDGAALPLAAGPTLTVQLPAWGVRSLVLDGGVGVDTVAAAYDEPVRANVAGRIERLRQRLAVLEAPAALDVLDNPNFDLGLGEPGEATAVTGWELVEARRGSLELVAGMPPRDDTPPAQMGRGLAFSSRHGLSTLRSNPFPPPAAGRISVAAWLRIEPGDPQPPLRMAMEGIEGSREYYRFAAVGGLAGGRPLTAEWSLFVLQVDDLPAAEIESLRVRFDLLGPGGVQIDDVRVFDLAFDADQRGRLAQQIAGISHRFTKGDVGAALVGLEGHWPVFLERFVTDAAVAAVVRETPPPDSAAPSPPADSRQGMVDRLRSWWQ